MLFNIGPMLFNIGPMLFNIGPISCVYAYARTPIRGYIMIVIVQLTMIQMSICRMSMCRNIWLIDPLFTVLYKVTPTAFCISFFQTKAYANNIINHGTKIRVEIRLDSAEIWRPLFTIIIRQNYILVLTAFTSKLSTQCKANAMQKQRVTTKRK